KWVFWLMFVGMHVTFLPMHLTGLMGMPRRVYTYLPDRAWELPNQISTVGAFIFAAAVLLWILDMVRNFRPFGPKDAGNVYDGPGLEWLPTGLYSVRSIPVVTSLYPLWDQPDLARDVEAGRYFLPNAAIGERETIITSTVNAEPQALMRMPRPSPWPIWSAVFTAGFFLLLTVQAYWPSVISGVLMIYCMIQWCWTLDRPLPVKTADIGAGIRVPTYIAGPSSHGWWAMIITLVVAGMVLAMAGFSYVFLWSRNPGHWVPPPEVSSFALVAIGNLAAIALAWTAGRLIRRDRPGLAAGALALAAALVAAAWGLDLRSWVDVGLRPEATAQGATVFAFLAWNGAFAAAGLIMGLYALARWLGRYLAAERPSTVDLIGLFLAYCAAQGLFAALLTRLFPGG
ncbi:MAG TPA: cbb3-type cytochrome c oxidase subunit I, partial [Caulobacter sp.]|nr:cbb3-type cytochrome c oxidase subunit I [Caulobacter sp.]